MSEPSTKKQKTSSKPQSAIFSGPRITDPRFANIQSDPRFRLPGKKNKVKLDKRFARVLQDDDFVKRAKVDRYGRPLESNAEKNRLKRKYEFDEENENDDVPDDDDAVQKELSRVDQKARDPLREGRGSDSESSDETSSDIGSDAEDEAEILEEELNVGQTQQQDVPTGEVTSRIAIVNLDWDNIHAADLMAVFSSFLPSHGGTLQRVAIYQSEFGKERLEREEMEGPPQEIFTNAAREDNQDENSSGDEDGDENIKASILKTEDGDEDFNPTALRKYQLERLRYFYAVLTFDAPSVAEHIYNAVDGTEYLHTANFFDLRFIPDDTDFKSDVPREDCERLPDDYKPNEFVTDALQHSKVKLTWDAEDTGRKEAAARAFKGSNAKGVKGRREMEDENDLRAYLASDNSDGEDEDEDESPVLNLLDDTAPVFSKKEVERQRMRTLLGLSVEPSKSSSTKKRDKGPVGDMQITFTSGLNPGTKDGAKRSVFENSPEPDETTVEKYVRKERDRKQKRREKMRAGREGDDAPDVEAPAITGQASQEGEQERQEGEEGGELGFDDPFFAGDPSKSPEKASTTSSNKLRKEERVKKRQQREAEEEKSRTQRAELELLMVDDDADDADNADNADAEVNGSSRRQKIQHFDMREIERAEKQARKRGQAKKQNVKAKIKADKLASAAEADAFRVNTSDPRFTQLFDSYEYAIDPTNPRFKGTKGMNALLEEGRKRKGKDQQEKGEDEGTRRRHKHGEGVAEVERGTPNVKRLVEKIRRQQ